MKKKYFLTISILILFYFFCYSQDYWESIYSSGGSILCLSINSTGYLFAGTQNGIYRSIDNGINWEEVLSVYLSKSIAINSQDHIYASPAPLYLSTDNGNNWTQLNLSYLYDVTNITVNTEDNIFVGFWGGICKSNDNGVSWELVLSFSNCEAVSSIVENSEGILFAGTTDFLGGGGVYRSLDNGENWEFIGLEYEYISSLAINSDDEIFAGSRGQHYEYGGGVFRSCDNGETWLELCDDVLVTSIAIDSEDKIYIGCSDLDGFTGAVHFSEDNGESWQLIESEMMPPNIGIEFITISEDDYVYAISYETIRHIYRSVQPSVGIDDFSIQKRNDFRLTNYPNPFNPTTTINYELPYNIENPVIEIFNIKGEKVKNLECGESLTTKADGVGYSISWDGTDNHRKQVSSGVYLYRLKSDEGVLMSKKMLLLR